MIDMQKLYEHEDYQDALDAFENSYDENDTSSCDYEGWEYFADVHKDITKDRCPICEVKFDDNTTRASNNGTTTIHATIDHYRPQHHYPFLKCDHENYLLMCSDCNTSYKNNDFPLHDSQIRATSKEEISDEKPLITNPINDDIYELFELVFKRDSRSSKNILELKPKASSGYLYEKAVETIKLFGLGDCSINRHGNDNIHNCRIGIFSIHYGVYYDLAIARKKDKFQFIKKLKGKTNVEKNGFAKFIAKNQFTIVE